MINYFRTRWWRGALPNLTSGRTREMRCMLLRTATLQVANKQALSVCILLCQRCNKLLYNSWLGRWWLCCWRRYCICCCSRCCWCCKCKYVKHLHALVNLWPLQRSGAKHFHKLQDAAAPNRAGWRNQKEHRWKKIASVIVQVFMLHPAVRD